jgi:phytoene dehydrogenase-like protein
MSHYFSGGYYPRGGGFSIPRAFVRALKRAGGTLLLETSVERIILENGRAVGIEINGGQRISARFVISNADPEMTYGRLIGRASLPRRLKNKLDRVTYSTSALSLFFAVDRDLKADGLDSGNYWLYPHDDLEQLYTAGLGSDFLDGSSDSALFMTVTTLKDPSKMHHRTHTLEAFAFVSYDGFEEWANEASGDRSRDYKNLKFKLADRMLSGLDRWFPGIKDSAVFCELGSPLTNQHYIAAHRGNLYGIDKTPRQVGPGAFRVRAPIDGLFLCGASTLSHGVSGATQSGLAAARAILGCSNEELLVQNGPPLRIYPAENPEQWPENLQRRIKRGQEA